MYELLSPVEDSLDMFAMELEEHLTNTGLAVMQSLQGENVRTRNLLIMAALRSRCGHYIFALWFLLSIYLFFFPCLISVVADWMSTVLAHMVWP